MNPDEPTRRKTGINGVYEYWRECSYCEGTGVDDNDNPCKDCDGEGYAWEMDCE